jgi:hypothetical protein
MSMEGHVVLGGLVVSVLVIGPKQSIFWHPRVDIYQYIQCFSITTQGSWIQTRLREIKIRSMPSFGGEVKLSDPCRKILWHVKEPFKV